MSERERDQGHGDKEHDPVRLALAVMLSQALGADWFDDDPVKEKVTAWLSTVTFPEKADIGSIIEAALSARSAGTRTVVDVPMIEAACLELLERSGLDLGGDEMRQVLEAALGKATRSASERTHPACHEIDGNCPDYDKCCGERRCLRLYEENATDATTDRKAHD